MSWTEKQMIFRQPDMELYSRLIDLRYVDYWVADPKVTQRAVIDKQQVKDALARVLMVVRNRENAVQLRLAENALTIYATNPADNAEATERIVCDYSHEPADGWVMGKSVQEFISRIAGKQMTMGFGTRKMLSVAPFDEKECVEFWLVSMKPTKA